MNKLLFIGGHHNSALATIDWLKENANNVEFYWIGKKNIDASNLSPEYTEISSRNIPFYDLKAGKLFRTTSIKYIPQVVHNLILIPYGFIQSLIYLSRNRPDLIVSFGGYLSVPVIIAGAILGIKSVLHEQTATIGLANEIASTFVQKVFTSWPEVFYKNERDSVKRKLEYTGLPIRKVIALDHEKINFPRIDKKTIYITGGKSGSLFINKLIIEVLDDLAKKYNVIWSTGRRIGEADYSAVIAVIKLLPEDIRHNILVKEYFLEDEIGKVFSTADIVITRGGGHTVYELALLKKPAIVIPIPWVSRQEQLKNARILESFGLARVLEQESTTPYKLISEIEAFSSELDNIKAMSIEKEFVPKNGQENLGHAIMEFFPS